MDNTKLPSRFLLRPSNLGGYFLLEDTHEIICGLPVLRETHYWSRMSLLRKAMSDLRIEWDAKAKNGG
jgi:hypothetical protein